MTFWTAIIFAFLFGTLKDFEGVEKLRGRINDAGLEAVMESSSTRGDRVSARLRVKDGS